MSATSSVCFADFEVDPVRQELRRGSVPLTIRRKPREVLFYLLGHRDRVVTRAELLARVWGGTRVSDEAVASAVRDLRRALGDDRSPHRIIVTVRGRGYFFAGAIGQAGRSVDITRSLRVSCLPIPDDLDASAFELSEEARELGIDIVIGPPDANGTHHRASISLRTVLSRVAEGASLEGLVEAFPGLRREQVRNLMNAFTSPGLGHLSIRWLDSSSADPRGDIS